MDIAGKTEERERERERIDRDGLVDIGRENKGETRCIGLSGTVRVDSRRKHDVF